MVFDKSRTAANLKAIRSLRGFSRQELAARSGISTASIKYYESAEAVMSLENAVKIADALDCSLESLVAEMKV